MNQLGEWGSSHSTWPVTEEESYAYKKTSGSAIVFLVLCVDDILLIENDIPMLKVAKSSLRKSFSMDFGEVAYILGIMICRDR